MIELYVKFLNNIINNKINKSNYKYNKDGSNQTNSR